MGLCLVLCWVPRMLPIPMAAKGRKRSSLFSQAGVPAYTLAQPPGKHPVPTCRIGIATFAKQLRNVKSRREHKKRQ